MKSFLVQIILQAAPERCSIYRTANINTLATIHLGNTHLKENQDTIGVLLKTKKYKQTKRKEDSLHRRKNGGKQIKAESYCFFLF